MHPSLFFFLPLEILRLFHIIPLLFFFRRLSLYVLLILCHRKLAYAAVEPLSIYAFIFSPHASLKYLIPLSFFASRPAQIIFSSSLRQMASVQLEPGLMLRS